MSKTNELREACIGSYPYKWIKVFYSNGGSYGSEPHNSDGEGIADETLLEVNGTELVAFLKSEKKKWKQEALKAMPEEIEKHADIEEVKDHEFPNGYLVDCSYTEAQCFNAGVKRCKKAIKNI